MATKGGVSGLYVIADLASTFPNVPETPSKPPSDRAVETRPAGNVGN